MIINQYCTCNTYCYIEIFVVSSETLELEISELKSGLTVCLFSKFIFSLNVNVFFIGDQAFLE